MSLRLLLSSEKSELPNLVWFSDTVEYCAPHSKPAQLFAIWSCEYNERFNCLANGVEFVKNDTAFQL